MWPDRAQTRFESLVRAYSADLYRFAYWLARDRVTAEDLVQESFARAWKNLDQLAHDGAAKSWLFTIVRNEHARLYAKVRPENDALAWDEMDELMDGALPLPAKIELNDALHHLPEAYREPLLLQVLGGFSCAEMSEIMGLSEANVMQRVSRARRLLREVLQSPCKRETAR